MKPTADKINAWIREQQARLGIETGGIPPVKSTVTVMLPSMAAVTRVAHAAVDEKIANDPVYDAMCARLDAELAEILEGGSARAPSPPDTGPLNSEDWAGSNVAQVHIQSQ
jgi:hypothetical protein